METDSDLLIPKARGALARYGHQVVIGNDLHRRKFEVVFVTPADGARPTPTVSQGQEPGELDPSHFSETWLRIDSTKEPDREIEEDIVAELVRRHQTWTSVA